MKKTRLALVALLVMALLVAVFATRGDVDLAVLNDHELDLNTSMMYRNEDYLAAIPQYPDDIGRRAAKEFFEIDGTNAHFMREDKL